MNLLTVIPFCQADAELAKRLVYWIQELEGITPNSSRPKCSHSCLVAYDSIVPLDTAKEVTLAARQYFRHVIPLAVKVDSKDWPKSSNLMFHNVAQFVKDTYRFPFLWLEPDCTPLRSGWLDELAAEYEQCPTPYMGTLIKTDEEGLPKVHMTGCSIYPANAIDLMKPFCDVNSTLAWDIGSAGEIAGKMKCRDTNLIKHIWGQRDLAPTFVYKKEPGKEYPINTMELAQIPESACLFHRCKDGSLITALKEQRRVLAEQQKPVSKQVESDVKLADKLVPRQLKKEVEVV
jgi:hypothetical protein